MKVEDLSSSTSNYEPYLQPDYSSINTNTQISTIRMFIAKIISGRFILTIITSICFLYLCLSLTKILVTRAEDIDTNQVILLITNV